MTDRVPREASIVAAICRWLEARPDTWVVKTHGGRFGRIGIPDLLVCVAGRFFAFEVKRPGAMGNVTPMQKRVLDRIERAGGRAAVVTSLDDVKALIDE